MSKIIYVSSCIQCPYVEINGTGFLYCLRHAGLKIGHEDKIKHIPKWCELKDKPVNNRKETGK